MNSAPCKNCGALDSKQWTTLRGRDVCDECWLDTAMDEQAAHWREAASNLRLQEPVKVTQSDGPSSVVSSTQNLRNGLTRRRSGVPNPTRRRPAHWVTLKGTCASRS